MSKDYEITIKTPQGKSKVEADSLEELLRLCPDEVAVAAGASRELSPKQVQIIYRNNYKGRTRLEMAGLELELFKCYLQGMTIRQALNWMEVEQQFATSMAAVARYWTKLSKLGVRKH